MMNRKALLLMLLLGLFLFTACSSNTNTDTNTTANTESEKASDNTQAESEKTISVNAFQYGYEPSTIELKVGETVKLVLTSSDVEHGFYVKGLNIDEKIIAGKETVVYVTPDKTGEYKIICTVYCGSGHNEMTGTLNVVE